MNPTFHLALQHLLPLFSRLGIAQDLFRLIGFVRIFGRILDQFFRRLCLRALVNRQNAQPLFDFLAKPLGAFF